MQHIFPQLLNITVAILLISCSTEFILGEGVDYFPTNVITRLNKKNDNQIEVYVRGRPDKDYRELGFLTYIGGTQDNNLAIKRMREKAAIIGADGLIIQDTDFVKRSWRGKDIPYRIYRGVAIIFSGTQLRKE